MGHRWGGHQPQLRRGGPAAIGGVDTGIAYDAFGRTTTSPASGGNVTIGYYVGDLVRSQTQAGLTRTWGLDAAGRFKTVTDTGTGSTRPGQPLQRLVLR